MMSAPLPARRGRTGVPGQTGRGRVADVADAIVALDDRGKERQVGVRGIDEAEPRVARRALAKEIIAAHRGATALVPFLTIGLPPTMMR